MIREIIKEYWYSSRHPFYGVVSVIPILLFYELIALSLNQNQEMIIRNAADVILKNIIIKQLMEIAGVHGLFAYGIVTFVVLAIVFWKKYNDQSLEFRPRYFIFMFIESLFYAVVIGPAIGYFTHILQHSILLTQSVFSFSFPQKVMLSLGAGFYEELVFRVILLSGSVFVLHNLLKFKKSTAYVLAALFSSVLFSAFHYVGPFGEPFEMYSFIFRLLAGLVFAGLYISRGFGIAVYTHTLYDLLIILPQ